MVAGAVTQPTFVGPNDRANTCAQTCTKLTASRIMSADEHQIRALLVAHAIHDKTQRSD